MSKAVGPNQNKSIEFTPTRYQDQFLRGDKRYVGFISGVGAGKTYAGIIRTFLNMEKWNPGEMGAIVAPTRQMIVNVIIPEMRDLGLLERWDYNSSYSDEPGIHAPNGSRALLLSADNKKTIERLRGLNLAWAWIDERTAVADRAKEILMQRLRTGSYRNLYETTTPKGRDGTYGFYVGDVETKAEEFGRATRYQTDDRLAIVGVPTDANPNLPDDYKAAMEADIPEEIRQQEVEGLFVEVGGGVFQREMFQWVEPNAVKDHLQPVIGVDPAATADSQAAQDRDSDFWGVTVGYPRPSQGEIYIADTIQRRGMTLKEGCNFIQAVANECDNPKLVIEANQSQRWLQQELADRGLNAVPVQTTRNKEDKIIDLSIPISSGKVKFVRWDENRFSELHQQMLAWPESNHDDMIDSLSLVVNHSDVNTSEQMFGGSYGESDLW
jgi:predicted phage terminase large subunit-like protein